MIGQTNRDYNFIFINNEKLRKSDGHKKKKVTVTKRKSDNHKKKKWQWQKEKVSHGKLVVLGFNHVNFNFETYFNLF